MSNGIIYKSVSLKKTEKDRLLKKNVIMTYSNESFRSTYYIPFLNGPQQCYTKEIHKQNKIYK